MTGGASKLLFVERARGTRQALSLPGEVPCKLLLIAGPNAAVGPRPNPVAFIGANLRNSRQKNRPAAIFSLVSLVSLVWR